MGYKDILIFQKQDKFFSGSFGSPLGEVNFWIETPAISLVNPVLYNSEIAWDVIVIDEKFSKEEQNALVNCPCNDIRITTITPHIIDEVNEL